MRLDAGVATFAIHSPDRRCAHRPDPPPSPFRGTAFPGPVPALRVFSVDHAIPVAGRAAGSHSTEPLHGWKTDHCCTAGTRFRCSPRFSRRDRLAGLEPARRGGAHARADSEGGLAEDGPGERGDGHDQRPDAGHLPALSHARPRACRDTGPHRRTRGLDHAPVRPDRHADPHAGRPQDARRDTRHAAGVRGVVPARRPPARRRAARRGLAAHGGRDGTGARCPACRRRPADPLAGRDSREKRCGCGGQLRHRARS